MRPFLVRTATLSDVPSLPAIERAAAVRFAPLGLAEVMGTVVTPIEDFLAGVDAGSLFVAEVDASLVGFALASPRGGGLHLDEIDVLPEQGRMGIGAALVGAVVELARERRLAQVTLSTLASVPWNAPWYARLGFRVMGDAEIAGVFAELLAHERARGLPMEDRVLMKRVVG